MEDTKPTEDQLKELYEAAVAFKQAQPWKWLYDADIICVENPKDKMMGYCSVMGRAGEHFALGVYLGMEGLYGFNQLMRHAGTIPGHQTLHYQNCLMCSFEDRDILAEEDRKQIKVLGLSFRGRNAWPMFRRYEPGYYPWFINKEECVFLTHALRQVLFVAENVLNGQLRMDMEHGRTIARYIEDANGEPEWHSEEMHLEIPAVSYNPVIITYDVLVQKIKKAGSMGNVSLQADICYMLSPVRDKKGERPYFPRLFILAEPKSGQILNFEMYDSIRDDTNVCLNKLIDFCLKYGAPKEIQVRNEAMIAILGDFCSKMCIKLKAVKRLASVDHMMEEMAQRFW